MISCRSYTRNNGLQLESLELSAMWVEALDNVACVGATSRILMLGETFSDYSKHGYVYGERIIVIFIKNPSATIGSLLGK